jgi:hypothetical protein
MNRFFRDIKNILIVVLLFLALYKFFIQSPPDPIIIESKITKWDTIKVDSIVYQPKWKTRWRTNWDTVDVNVDTSAILDDYFAKYYYSDTLGLDTLGTIVVEDTITENKIHSRVVHPNILQRTITVDRTEILNPNEFYLGGGVGSNYLGLEALYRSNKGLSYGLGVGLDNQLNTTFSGRVLWKLETKKFLWLNL